MILNQTNDLETTTLDQGHDFSIDKESLGLLFKGFSDSLYSNKIGSIVREIASNCYDAHQQLGINKDIHITMKRPDAFTSEQGSISFRDFGIGLTPESIKDIYSKYFASTKRSTNDQIGGFGIGAKSPLAYSDIFDVITIVDGIEYHYMIHRGANVPRIELINKEPSSKERGTEVIIPIKSNADADKFETEIKSQLRYFDGIQYFGIDIDNDYQIIRGKYFIFNSIDESKKDGLISMCIGKVRYPLNTDLVFPGFSSYALRSNIALYFEVGELSVTMNRESVEYTDKAIQVIQKRFEEAEDELIGIKESLIEKQDTEDLLEALSLSTTSSVTFPGGITPKLPDDFKKIHAVTSDSWAYPAFKDFKYLKPSRYYWDLFLRYTHRYIARKKGKVFKTQTKLYHSSIENLIIKAKEGNPNRDLWRNKGTITAKKMEYLKHLAEEENKPEFSILTLKENIDFYSLKEICGTMSYNGVIDDSNREDLEAELKILRQHFMKYFMKLSKSVVKTEIDPDWEKAYKESRRKGNYDKTIITLRQKKYGYRMLKTKAGDFYKEFVPKDVVVVYGFQGEEYEIASAYSKAKTTSNENGFEFIKIARGNVKYLKAYYPKAYHWEEWEELDSVKEKLHQRQVISELKDHLRLIPGEVLDRLSYFLKTTDRFKRAVNILADIKNRDTFNVLLTYNRYFKTSCTLEYFPEASEDELSYSITCHRLGIKYEQVIDAIIKYLEDNPLFLELISELDPENQEDTEKMRFLQKSIQNHFNIFKL